MLENLWNNGNFHYLLICVFISVTILESSLEIFAEAEDVYILCCVCLVAQLYPTLCDCRDCSCQVPLSMGFSRQEYWSGLPCPPPADLLNPEIKPRSATLQVASLSSEPRRKPKNTGVGSLSLLQGNFPN